MQIFSYKGKKICLYISDLFKIWILRFLELKNKLWTKTFSTAISSSWTWFPCLPLQSLSPQRSPSQQTCGTWDGSSDPHWDTNKGSLCLQYLQYPHRYCFDWKLQNLGQTETDDSCEMKKNVSNFSTLNWLWSWDAKIFWWKLADEGIITLLYITAPADPFEKDCTQLMIDLVSNYNRIDGHVVPLFLSVFGVLIRSSGWPWPSSLSGEPHTLDRLTSSCPSWPGASPDLKLQTCRSPHCPGRTELRPRTEWSQRCKLWSPVPLTVPLSHFSDLTCQPRHPGNHSAHIVSQYFATGLDNI